MNKHNFFNRRLFLKTSLLGGAAGFFSTGILAKLPTPADAEGPFYPITPQQDKDFDLTRVQGGNGIAKGKVVYIVGQVLDTSAKPVKNVTVDIWQANAAGRYHHPSDSNSAPLDENFQGWAIVQSGVDGAFKFKTVMPGAYSSGWFSMRTPHIHFKVSKAGYRELVTQLYFPNQPLNDKDSLFTRKSLQERQLMTAVKTSDDPETYQYTIVIESV